MTTFRVSPLDNSVIVGQTAVAALPDARLRFPLLNGARPDFANIELRIINLQGTQVLPQLVDIEAVEYDDETATKFKHLSGSLPVARSRGTYRASGAIEWGLETHRAVVQALMATGSGGFGDARFDIQITYAGTPNDTLMTDVLQDVRIVGNSQRNSVGGKRLTTRTALSIAQIVWGGNTGLLTAPLNQDVLSIPLINPTLPSRRRRSTAAG